jgi:hypothetical protein
MTQYNKEALSSLLLAACERKSLRENRRTAKGDLKPYTSYRLSKSVKIDTAHAYRVLRGDTVPSRDLLIRICVELGCSQPEIAEIFSQTDYRTPSQEELEEESSAVA